MRWRRRGERRPAPGGTAPSRRARPRRTVRAGSQHASPWSCRCAGRSRGPVLASLALAAGLGVVALGLGARTVTLQQDLDAATAQVAALESTLASQGGAMTVAMDPPHVTVALHGDALAPAAEAAVVFVPGDDAVLDRGAQPARDARTATATSSGTPTRPACTRSRPCATTARRVRGADRRGPRGQLRGDDHARG